MTPDNKPADQPKVGDLVWFKMARMYGTASERPMRAMVTKVRDNRRVDLEIGCEDMSQTSGTAQAVQHRADIPPALHNDASCWWNGELPEDQS